MNTDGDLIEQLDLDATVVEETDPERALQFWREAQALAQKNIGSVPTAEWHYRLGYLSYMIWARTGEAFFLTEKSLEECLRLDSHHEMALFYLGALYFESGRYQDAMPILGRLTNGHEFFGEIGQPWRYVKALEMLAAVELVEGRDNARETFFAKLEQAYGKLEEPEATVPITIVGTLDRLLANEAEPAKYAGVVERVQRIVELTNSTNFVQRRFAHFSTAAGQSRG
jgi:tetratricopeptide (TPR) repeat protein